MCLSSRPYQIFLRCFRSPWLPCARKSFSRGSRGPKTLCTSTRSLRAEGTTLQRPVYLGNVRRLPERLVTPALRYVEEDKRFLTVSRVERVPVKRLAFMASQRLVFNSFPNGFVPRSSCPMELRTMSSFSQVFRFVFNFRLG